MSIADRSSGGSKDIAKDLAKGLGASSAKSDSSARLKKSQFTKPLPKGAGGLGQVMTQLAGKRREMMKTSASTQIPGNRKGTRDGGPEKASGKNLAKAQVDRDLY